MPRVVAIYGKTCSLKSDVAREVSRLTGYKVKHPGEAITTRAKVAKLNSGTLVPENAHRGVDRDTLEWATSAPDPVVIIESTLLNAVLGDLDNVFLVHLHSSDDVRKERWYRRREEGGGRTRQIGESVEQRDKDDTELRQQLHGATSGTRKPDLELDTTERSADDCASEIWAAFEGGAVKVAALRTGKPAMDKKQTKGIRPGPSSGIVRVYSAKRNPFGGYITDDKSGKDIFVHKLAVEESGIEALKKGQQVNFDIIEDGFGGFKATNVKPAS